MSKAYKVAKRTMNMGEKKGQTVYTVQPHSYGTLTTEEVAQQISTESTATSADVKAVLDRYAYYVQENLKKGYDIELLGFGKLYIRFLKSKAVTDEKLVNAKMVKALVPAFRPSFTLLKNGSRLYDLLPAKIELVKYKEEDEKKEPTSDGGGGSKPSGDGGTTPSGGGSSETPGGSGSGTDQGGGVVSE